MCVCVYMYIPIYYKYVGMSVCIPIYYKYVGMSVCMCVCMYELVTQEQYTSVCT